MSQVNPYQSTAVTYPLNASDIRKVKVRPFQLLQRGYDLIRGQYWLFFGLSIVAMLISSAVPFGIIMGPMLVGLYLCFLARERGDIVDFEKLFRGFDFFRESFIATLVIVAATFIVILPLMLVFAVVMLFLISPQQNAGNEPPPILFLSVLLSFYALLLFVNVLIILPFLFTFQLIADRNVTGIDAVKLSFQGVRRNFFGVIGYMIVITIVSLVLTMMCCLPVLFFLPISFASLFVLYRDIYPVSSNHLL